MNAGVRESWRKTVLSFEAWEKHIETAEPGEAGGFYVRLLESQLVAYLKPLKKNLTHPRAAYEKIASDLAYEVGVNLPPVVLHRRPDISEENDANPDFSPPVSMTAAGWLGAARGEVRERLTAGRSRTPGI